MRSIEEIKKEWIDNRDNPEFDNRLFLIILLLEIRDAIYKK